MRGERYALRAGEYLVARASRRLPAGIRQERCKEWAAELPVILHDRDAGPAPRRVLRMLTFAADTLRGTTLAHGSYQYQGAHRGGTAKNTRKLAIGLPLLLAGLLVLLVLLALVAAALAFEGWIIYQLVIIGNLTFCASFIVSGLILLLILLLVDRIRRSDSADSWAMASQPVAGTGPFIRALASHFGWGHPLMFAIISYCGYAISIALIVVIARSSHRRQRPDPQA
jgi:hypothetical protein